MRIQDIQSAEAELSFHWRLMPVTARSRRSFVIKFLEATEVSSDREEVRKAFYSKSWGTGNPLIYFMLAKLIFDVLWAWWQTRNT